jgi:hypothetical protein
MKKSTLATLAIMSIFTTDAAFAEVKPKAPAPISWEEVATCGGQLLSISILYDGLAKEDAQTLTNNSYVIGGMAVERLVTVNKLSTEEARAKVQPIFSHAKLAEDSAYWTFRMAQTHKAHQDKIMAECSSIVQQFIKESPPTTK